MRLDQELAELERLNLAGLREVWARRYGFTPKLRSPELLRLNLAWRMQAEVYGGLDAETRALLRKAPPKRARDPRLVPGTRITKEHLGCRHEVVVADDGAFLYGGRSYRSLSHIAREITGVRWNGPRFFGLREAA